MSAEIAVVVPARNAAATIGRTLAALDGAEVVVVDDASDDDTAAVAELAGARVVRLTRQGGPGAARNAGVAATSAPLLAFTDADCEPAPGWLDALRAALRDADLVTGRVLPAGRARTFDRTLQLDGASPRFETANLAVRRATFDAVGGFERLPGGPTLDEGHFGEDVVFGWRAVRAGARTAYAADALVRHAVFARGPRGYIAERRRLRFFPALVREVPELRDALPLRTFLTERTMLFDLALAGVALARRRPDALALAIPYVMSYLRTDQPWRRSVARHNLALVAGDAVGLAALVRGSLAARRLLL